MSDDVPEPDDFSEKEVFAFFGLASYLAGVLEEQLSSFAAMLHLSGRTGVTREFVNELFDTMERHTLGRLLREARQLTTFPSTAEQVLQDALRERNILTHHFFRYHAANFMLERGRAHMIEQLRRIALLFQNASAEVAAIQMPLAKKLGITEAIIERMQEEMLGEATRRNGA